MSSEYFYPGTAYTLESGYGNPSTLTGDIAITTDSRTANQIQEVSNKLNTGLKSIEVDVSSGMQIFEAVPEQQLSEINRLAKLTGAEINFHAPIVEPSGFSQQGRWSEQDRELTERQLKEAILRAHKMRPDGGMAVTVHSSAISGSEFVPIDLIKNLTPQEKEIYGKTGKVPIGLVIVNQETGEPRLLRREEIYYPGKEEKEVFTPLQRLYAVNSTGWDQKINNMNFYKKEADEIMQPAVLLLRDKYEKFINGEINMEQLNPQEQEAVKKIFTGGGMLDDIQMQFKGMYDEARKYINIKEIAEKDPGNAEEVKIRFDEINRLWKKEEQEKKHDPLGRAKLIENSMYLLNNIRQIAGAPRTNVPIEHFATNQASETFSNIALESYKKFGDKSPILTIENPPYGQALSDAEGLKQLIEVTKQKFIDKAAKNGISRSEAKQAAEKMIAATWDVGHINMMKKYGFEKEHLLKETESIAPYVKKVHLSDNFGFEHTELPMGMGNVPFKEEFMKLEKQGFKGKKVIEAYSWYQHFHTLPVTETLEALGSPLYPMIAQPSWSEVANTRGEYTIPYGNIFPSGHSTMYGSSFTALPSDLGGQASGARSGFSGAPTT